MPFFCFFFFFFQAEDGIRDYKVTGVQTCALPILRSGTRQELGVLAGRRVVAAAGIADPESFAQQLGTAGASVQLVAYQDPHAYRQADLERLGWGGPGGECAR